MPSKFSPEIMKLIENGDLKEAQRLASEEILNLYVTQQREHIEIAKKWLK